MLGLISIDFSLGVNMRSILRGASKGDSLEVGGDAKSLCKLNAIASFEQESWPTGSNESQNRSLRPAKGSCERLDHWNN